ncbi:liprin-alpha-4 [Trichonephila clavipes]|nr:liprin-alpha-4 [Trichonephila clavipes]
MMCDVMPTIAEDSLGQRGGQFAADEANFEQLMVNILDERDKLLETLRDTQENLANTHIKINDLSKERDSLQRQLQANLPQELFKEAGIIKSFKMGRLRFAVHICRMEPSSLTFRIFNYKPIGTRIRGRPKLRWADCVEHDFKV